MAIATAKVRALGTRIAPFAPAIIIAAGAAFVAWYFAVTTLRHTRPMGLPLDDSYIYLTYAKQFGRAEPFSYFPGGGYSAGSTSVLWPMVLAPFWTLGARGHALVWVSYVLCSVLYALTAIGMWRVVRRITGDTVAGVVAAVMVLAIAPFAWTSLSGMEVAFASALLVAMILLLVDQPPHGPPTKRLIAVLAAASLSRPEATLVVGGVVAIAVVQRLRQRAWRAAAWWAAPLVAPFAWVVANKLIAGNFFPNTGVAKSYFYLPGFDWSFWVDTVWVVTGKLLEGLFWKATSPLVWPEFVALAWLVGSVRVALWARREQRYLAGALLVGAPLVLLEAVVASSGAWDFQNYRYVAPAFPLLLLAVGCAFAVPSRVKRRPVRIGWSVATLVVALLFVRSALPALRSDARLFAQGAMDTNTQVVRIGQFIRDKLPDAFVMFHDAGAIAYYGDGKVYDMLGLVTNHQAHVTNHGPGSRFEFLEGLPVDKRPTHFAYYPSWLIGTPELYGPTLLATPLRPGIEKRRFAGDGDMQVLVADWSIVGTGELPLIERAGWRVVDRIDIAHLASERAHAWHGALGRRKHGDRTAKWSFVARELGTRGPILDGGRTIRGGSERFAIDTDRQRPARLVMRTGGPTTIYNHEPIGKPLDLRVFGDDQDLGTIVVPPPRGPFVELEIALPPGIRTVRTRADSHYRVFHWFVLQPD